MSILKEYMAEKAKVVDFSLSSFLPSENMGEKTIHKSMRYSIFAGGKRLRPILAIMAYEACGGKNLDIVMPAACSLEMVHAFSLIHDDLPCMDDDDFRRGKPTNHKVFGEAIAVLAGDALCIHAFEVLANSGRADLISVLATALNTGGMLGGQVADIESEGKAIDADRLKYIHTNKTEALITASLKLGAMCANATKEQLNSIEKYGASIGLAFQIADDCLDITSTTEELGKDVGSDQEKEKATYPALFGLDESQKMAKNLIKDAKLALDKIDGNTSLLADLADYIIERVN